MHGVYLFNNSLQQTGDRARDCLAVKDYYSHLGSEWKGYVKEANRAANTAAGRTSTLQTILSAVGDAGSANTNSGTPEAYGQSSSTAASSNPQMHAKLDNDLNSMVNLNSAERARASACVEQAKTCFDRAAGAVSQQQCQSQYTNCLHAISPQFELRQQQEQAEQNRKAAEAAARVSISALTVAGKRALHKGERSDVTFSLPDTYASARIDWEFHCDFLNIVGLNSASGAYRTYKTAAKGQQVPPGAYVIITVEADPFVVDVGTCYLHAIDGHSQANEEIKFRMLGR